MELAFGLVLGLTCVDHLWQCDVGDGWSVWVLTTFVVLGSTYILVF